MYYLRYKKYELLVGFGIALCFMFVVVSILKVDESNTGRFNYTARFKHVDGIVEGSRVKIAGVPVGIVKSLYLDKNLRAVVSITVHRDVILDTDSVASITTPGMFGKKYIQLDVGSGDVLESGREILHTEDSLILEDLLKLISSRTKKHNSVEKNNNSERLP